jgi:integrase
MKRAIEKNMPDRGQGWLTKVRRKKGAMWLHRYYFTRDVDGKRVETTSTIGLVSKFPRESDAWAEVMRRSRIGLPGRLTVVQLIDSYEQNELPQKARSTQELHRQILEDHIRVRWGKNYVDEVRVLELRQWFVAIVEKYDFAAQTMQKIKQVFGRLYRYGCENELIAPNLNPVRDCNIRGIGTKRKSKPIVVRPETAWKIAMDLDIMRRTLVLLAAATGMRISELLGLQWHDIDYERQIIHINRTWLYGYVGEGKSDESRQPVALGARITECLKGWHGETPYASPTDWVFPSFKLKGKQPLSGSQFVKDYIRPRFIQHGLIEPAYTGRAGLHAFRHSLASVLITEEHVDPKTAQAILRHASSDITMDLYTHAQEEPKRKALEKFEARLVQ